MSAYNGGYFTSGGDGGFSDGGSEFGGNGYGMDGGMSGGDGNSLTRVFDNVKATVVNVYNHLGSVVMWLVKVVAMLIVLFILLHLVMFFWSGDYKFYADSCLNKLYEKIKAGNHTPEDGYLLTRELYFSTRAYNRDLTRARTAFARFAKTDAKSNPNRYMDSHRYDVAEFRYIMADNALLRSSRHLDKIRVLVNALYAADKARDTPVQSRNYYTAPSQLVEKVRGSAGDVISSVESFVSTADKYLNNNEAFSNAGSFLDKQEAFTHAGNYLDKREAFTHAGNYLDKREAFKHNRRREHFTDDNSNVARTWGDYIRSKGIDSSVLESHAEYIGNNPTNVPRNAALTIRDSITEPVTRWGLRNVNYDVVMDGTARTIPSEYEDQVYKENKRTVRW
jgi:hypothetical protein